MKTCKACAQEIQEPVAFNLLDGRLLMIHLCFACFELALVWAAQEAGKKKP
jgi:hypothetical protein